LAADDMTKRVWVICRCTTHFTGLGVNRDLRLAIAEILEEDR